MTGEREKIMIFKLMIIKCPVGNETFERRERK
nr:MAG TPA: protein of unknown function (DUF2225) [Caudoviricetes sp.]